MIRKNMINLKKEIMLSLIIWIKNIQNKKQKQKQLLKKILVPKIEKLLKEKNNFKNINVEVIIPPKSGFNDYKTNLPDKILIKVKGDINKDIILKKFKNLVEYFPQARKKDIYDLTVCQLVNKIMKGGHGLFSKNYSVVSEEINYFPY